MYSFLGKFVTCYIPVLKAPNVRCSATLSVIMWKRLAPLCLNFLIFVELACLLDFGEDRKTLCKVLVTQRLQYYC